MESSPSFSLLSVAINKGLDCAKFSSTAGNDVCPGTSTFSVGFPFSDFDMLPCAPDFLVGSGEETLKLERRDFDTRGAFRMRGIDSLSLSPAFRLKSLFQSGFGSSVLLADVKEKPKREPPDEEFRDGSGIALFCPFVGADTLAGDLVARPVGVGVRLLDFVGVFDIFCTEEDLDTDRLLSCATADDVELTDWRRNIELDLFVVLLVAEASRDVDGVDAGVVELLGCCELLLVAWFLFELIPRY